VSVVKDSFYEVAWIAAAVHDDIDPQHDSAGRSSQVEGHAANRLTFGFLG
jgi:hypothetical protein